MPGTFPSKKCLGNTACTVTGNISAWYVTTNLFVKITEPGLKLLPQQEQGSPYSGARPHFLMTELDDDRALSSFVRATCSVLSAPDVLSGKKKKASGEKRNRRP